MEMYILRKAMNDPVAFGQRSPAFELKIVPLFQTIKAMHDPIVLFYQVSQYTCFIFNDSKKASEYRMIMQVNCH